LRAGRYHWLVTNAIEPEEVILAEGTGGAMTVPATMPIDTAVPTGADVEMARDSSRRLAGATAVPAESLRMRLGEGATVDVPTSAVKLFLHLLSEMGRGHAVAVLPTHAELTAGQAAEILNADVPFVVTLIDEGRLVARHSGGDLRVRLDDLMEFKRRDDAVRAEIADRLTAEAQELGLGY
jgi:excisionase family DNA binding protein